MTGETKPKTITANSEEASAPESTDVVADGNSDKATPATASPANQDELSSSDEKPTAEDSSQSASGEEKPGKKSGRGGSSDKTKRASIRMAKSKADIVKAAKTLKKSSGKVVLAPVDFSEHSVAAMVLGAELAECTDTKLLVLHVVHDPGEMPGYYNKMIKKKRLSRIQDIAEDVFKEFMEGVIEDHPKLKQLRKAETMMVMGIPVTRILEVIAKVEPTLVVVGSQGRTGLKHLLLGSKAEQLVHLCPVPITVVKTKKLGI